MIHTNVNTAECTIPVHGNEEPMRQFEVHLTGAEVVMPAWNEAYTI